MWYRVTMSVVAAIAAIGKNRVLGKANKLLWHIPDDLMRFKKLTLGHPIVLGRKTFESILGYLGEPLPARKNIIVTHDPKWHYEGTIAAPSVLEAIETGKALDSEWVSIGGGAQIYAEALPYTSRLCLTIIDAEPPAGGEGDAFFPEYESEFTNELFREEHEWNGLKYTWVDLER